MLNPHLSIFPVVQNTSAALSSALLPNLGNLADCWNPLLPQQGGFREETQTSPLRPYRLPFPVVGVQHSRPCSGTHDHPGDRDGDKHANGQDL